MESRESQRDKRINQVIRDTKSPPSTSVMRAREELQGIEAERASNLERQKIMMQSQQSQMNTMREAAIFGASGMVASSNPRQVALASQAAAMNPGTQAILQKYGVKPGKPQTTQSSRTQSNVSQGNIRTTTTNNTTTNTRNEIKIVQPQIPMRQQQIPMRNNAQSDMNKFKAWLDSSFAKQQNQFEIQQKEYRKREWNLARNSAKLFNKLADSTKSLGEKMDPKNMGSTLGGQLKTLLFLFLATTVTKWWRPLMKTIANVEAGVKSIFGIPVNADLQKGGAEGYNFVNKIKQFIGIPDSEKNGKGLLGGIKDVITDGVDRLIKTFKLFMEDRKLAIQKITMPDFKMPEIDTGGISGAISRAMGSVFRGIMAPATGYLGDILSALVGGSKGVVSKAGMNIRTMSKDSWKHKYGGQYYNSSSTDMMGNLKGDSTWGLSQMMSREMSERSGTLHTGSIMTGMGMLNNAAEREGSVVVAPEFLQKLGFGPNVIQNLVSRGQATYLPYKLVKVNKSEAERDEYTRGGFGSHVVSGIVDWLNPFSSNVAAAGATGKGLLKSKSIRQGIGALSKTGLKWASRATGGAGMLVTGAVGAADGALNYANDLKGYTGYTLKAVPMSDPRPGEPIQVLRITKAGFDTLKSSSGIKEFSATDRNFRAWAEAQERKQKAIVGYRGKFTQENANQIRALDYGHQMVSEYDSKMNHIWHDPGAFKSFADNTRSAVATGSRWVAGKFYQAASMVGKSPSVQRKAVLQALYQSLKSALDKKRPDLSEQKRDAFARMMTSQAMLESGGKYKGTCLSRLAVEGNNYGGVIAPGGKGVGGRPIIYFPNGSTYDNQKYYTRFRDMDDWAMYQVGLLGGKRYRIFDKDVSEYARALKEGGYHGISEEEYSNRMMGVMKQVNASLGGAGAFGSMAGSVEYYNATGTYDTNGFGTRLSIPDNVEKTLAGKTVDQNLMLGDWHVGKAIAFLNKNASPRPTHWCARHVRMAMEAGGMKTDDRPNAACGYIRWLPKIGWVPFRKRSEEDLQPGDICVTDRNSSHKWGHIAMWNGKQWVSDFVQRSDVVYHRNTPPNYYFRYSGHGADMSGKVFSGNIESLPEPATGGAEVSDEGEVSTTDKIKGAVATALVSMGDAANSVATKAIGKTGSEPTKFDKSKLSAEQLATWNWAVKAGAKEDAAGLYLQGKDKGTRAYIDLNSGISETGHLTKDNILGVAKLGKNGTIDHFIDNPIVSEALAGKMLGDTLKVNVAGGKSGGFTLGVDLGKYFRDYTPRFTGKVRNYLENHKKPRGVKFKLESVDKISGEIYEIQTGNIPIIDENGVPLMQSDGKSVLYWGKSGNSAGAWVPLIKRGAFSGGSSEHPWISKTLGVEPTLEAWRIINAIQSYIRGEASADSIKELLGEDLPAGLDFNNKNLLEAQEKLRESGAANIRDALGVSRKSIEKSIADFKPGKFDSSKYSIYRGDGGEFQVYDSSGNFLGLADDEKGNGFQARRANEIDSDSISDPKALLNGRIRYQAAKGDFDSLAPTLDFNYYNRLYDTGYGKYKNTLRSQLSNAQGSKIISDDHGNKWRLVTDSSGNVKLVPVDPGKIDVSWSQQNLAGLLKSKGGYNLGEHDVGKALSILKNGIGVEEVEKIFGSTRGLRSLKDIFEKGWILDNETSLRTQMEYAFGKEEADKRFRRARTTQALSDEWLEHDSDVRKAADASIEAYNNGETQGFENVHGYLFRKDQNGNQQAVGFVGSDGKARAFGKNKIGASTRAMAQYAVSDDNSKTITRRASRKAWIASKYGAKTSPGNPDIMYIDTDDGRISFNINEISEAPTLDEIKKVGTIWSYDEDGYSWYESKPGTEDGNLLFGGKDNWRHVTRSQDQSHFLDNLGKTVGSRAKINKDDYIKEYAGALRGQLEQENLAKASSDDFKTNVDGHLGTLEDLSNRSVELLEGILKNTGPEGAKDLQNYEAKFGKGPRTTAEKKAVDAATKEYLGTKDGAFQLYRNTLASVISEKGGKISDNEAIELAYKLMPSSAFGADKMNYKAASAMKRSSYIQDMVRGVRGTLYPGQASPETQSPKASGGKSGAHQAAPEKSKNEKETEENRLKASAKEVKNADAQTGIQDLQRQNAKNAETTLNLFKSNMEAMNHIINPVNNGFTQGGNSFKGGGSFFNNGNTYVGGSTVNVYQYGMTQSPSTPSGQQGGGGGGFGFDLKGKGLSF